MVESATAHRAAFLSGDHRSFHSSRPPWMVRHFETKKPQVIAATMMTLTKTIRLSPRESSKRE